MKTLTIFKLAFAYLAGVIGYWVGGYDIMSKTMLTIMVLDFLTGIGQAIFNGKFNCKKCAKGIMKKVFILFTVALSVVIQHFMGDNIPIREVVVMFYIVNEGMSTLENIGKVHEYPAKLKNIFEELQNRNE